jgi:hypothetical protein
MNTKRLVPALAALVLSSAGVALADDGHGRGHAFHGPQNHGWQRDGSDRAEHHWHEYRHYSEPRWHGYWAPAPVWHYQPRPYYYHDYYAQPYYDDGLTIIFRGRIN